MIRSLTRSASWTAALALLLAACPASAQNASNPGAVTTPYPTFTNASIEWQVDGDANANGVVTVHFRKQGEAEWREGLPLFRVLAGSNAGHSWTSKHAGSLFGLEPGTIYEVELALQDPDGGSLTKPTTVTTRSYPNDAVDARTVAVTPATFAAALADAEPGDVLLLGNGTYDGFTVESDGTPGRPVVLRAAEPLGAVIRGNVEMFGRAYIHLEDLEIHGRVRFNDSESIVVRRCKVATTSDGLVSYGEGVDNAYLADNLIIGATQWQESALGVNGDNIGEGVQITGAGNVIAFNRVVGFRDCISFMEESEAVNQVSNDVYGNDLDICADDAVEADYAMGNVRIYQNRIRRSFMGISSQPSLGGPTYFIRNVMYGVIYEAFKLHNGTVGDVILHNTVVKSGDAFAVYTDDSVSRAYVRNNLFLGGPGGEYGGYDSGDGAVISLRTADETCSLDYDGLGSIGTGTFSGQIGDEHFASLAELKALDSERNGVQVDYGVFAASVTFPTDPFSLPDMPSLALASGGGAMDRGVVLPNVNDGFSGSAPDLGAYEVGVAEPVYGPSGTLGTDPDGSGGGGSPVSSGCGFAAPPHGGIGGIDAATIAALFWLLRQGSKVRSVHGLLRGVCGAGLRCRTSKIVIKNKQIRCIFCLSRGSTRSQPDQDPFGGGQEL